MSDNFKSIMIDAFWVLSIVLCIFAAFAIGIGWGIENGKHIQMAVNQNTLASCQELVSKK